jgi:hypothetical protein
MLHKSYLTICAVCIEFTSSVRSRMIYKLCRPISQILFILDSLYIWQFHYFLPYFPSQKLTRRILVSQKWASERLPKMPCVETSQSTLFSTIFIRNPLRITPVEVSKIWKQVHVMNEWWSLRMVYAVLCLGFFCCDMLWCNAMYVMWCDMLRCV